MKKYNIKTTDVELLKKWYYLMTLGRALDEKAPAYLLQSLGWSFHAPYAGHDGIQLAIGQVFTKGEDFLFPYYRDMLTALSAGMTAEELILNGISKATDPGSGGRHMSNHFAKPEWHIENISSATGTHDLHAAGVARAMVYYDHKGVVITSHGESASSEGFVYEAVNGASLERLPVIFVWQDNGYGISVPKKDQTAARKVADNFSGFKNLKIIYCNGKDVFASIFFVSVGMMIDPAMMWEYAVPILTLTLLVLSGQVLFGSFGVLLSGQPLKIAIQSGFSLTQVGEFAFIIASLGVSLNVTDKYLYPVIVAVSVITTFLTPYMIRLSEPAYRFIDIHMPGFLKDYLVHYTSGAMTVKHQGTWHKLIRSMLVSVTLYLVVCVFFITLYFSYVHPLIRKSLPGMEGNLLGFIIIFLVISPFLWAIIMKRNNSTEFRKLWTDNKFNRGPLVSIVLVKILICTIIMMSIITHLFNVALGAGLVVSSIIIAVIYFSKRIKKRSLTIERQFMANFQGTDGNGLSTESDTGSTLGSNIPFKELHLADFTVSPDSIYVGRTLKESSLRTLFQINVISITRGEKRLDIPQGEEHLYPYDKVTVVGTDRQLESFRTSMEQKKVERNGNGTSSQDEMEIGQFPVEGGSPLIGKTIREADISDSIIIGIERSTVNIMNPDPDTIFKENDTVWIVGKRKIIKGLNKD